jgi:hypothetical protein
MKSLRIFQLLPKHTSDSSEELYWLPGSGDSELGTACRTGTGRVVRREARGELPVKR